MDTLSDLKTVLNVDLEEAKENIRRSSRLDLPWLQKSEPHDGVALICGGGPSLRDTIPEIRVRAMNGQTVFAINQVANVLHGHGIKPDYQFVMDALPQSADYLTGVCGKYILASQCNPETFTRVNPEDVILFHAMGTFPLAELLPPEKLPMAREIGGGVTALTRCMAVAHVMGFRVQHIYGADSSRRGKEHHAYVQSEDDGLHETVVELKGKQFKTSLAMAAQVSEFLHFTKALVQQDAQVHVHGDGLLPYACQVAQAS